MPSYVALTLCCDHWIPMPIPDPCTHAHTHAPGPHRACVDLACTQDPHACTLCVPTHAFEHVSSHGNLLTCRPQSHISFFPPTSSQYTMHLSRACTFPSPTRALHSTSSVCAQCSYQLLRLTAYYAQQRVLCKMRTRVLKAVDEDKEVGNNCQQVED